MSKGTKVKTINVKEDQKTSLHEAGIGKIRLEHGAKVLCIGSLNWPDHDRSLWSMLSQYIESIKPDLILILGPYVNEEAWKRLGKPQDNYLHKLGLTPEEVAARTPTAEELAAKKPNTFDRKVQRLSALAGKEIERIAELGNSNVIWVPSATHLSTGNEVRLMEFVQSEKRYLDQWQEKNQKSAVILSDPSIELSRELSKLFELDNSPNAQVRNYGSAVLINNKWLFLVGDFRRRQPLDAALVEWKQRGLNIIRAFDGKSGSAYFTTPRSTKPYGLDHHDVHEVGHLKDLKRMGHERDYDLRTHGFWEGVVVGDVLDGHSIVFEEDDEGRRFFQSALDGQIYEEAEPGGIGNEDEIVLPKRKKKK
jgi:hypothetical protein